MTVVQMREALLAVYPTEGWYKKVMAMHDNQIIAVYRKFLEKGKIL